MKQILMMALGVSTGFVMLGACTRGDDFVVATPELMSYGQVTSTIGIPATDARSTAMSRA